MNHRIESMKPSASMVLMARAKEMQKTDPTVIGLAGGEPDFPTPDRISMAAIRSLTEGYTHYVVGPGLPELRQAIQKKLREENDLDYDVNCIIVTPGGKNAIYLAVQAILNEGDEVEEAFRKWDINFVRVDAEELFLSKLAGVSEPERKRKIIGEEFIRVFEAEAKKIGQVDYLAQGTIYPDVIESGAGDAAVIKSHHNVGGLPDYVDFKEIIEPLRMLFKDEVRQLGRELGLPEYLVMRQPFPGPGLAIRCLGDVTKEKLDILRLADFIFRDEVAKAHLESAMSQYFAVLTNMRSVGVQGDGRTYDYTLALRSVTTTDFMTADWTRIPYDVLDRVSVRIVNEVPHINRIVYDITSKPPATIEFE